MQPPPISTKLPPETVQKVWQSAQDFEAVALNEFLKPMFDTIDLSSTPLGGGEAEQTWKPMLVDSIAKQIAHAGGLGIAEPVFRQMIQMQEAKSEGQP